MIAFGTAVTNRETYARYARAGFDLAAEPDSIVIARDNDGTLSDGYNEILERARGLEGLEALVLVHQDLEITDAAFCATVRDCLADPEVAVIGCAGAERVTGLAWWDPGPVLGSYDWVPPQGEPVPMDEWDAFVQVETVTEVAAIDGMVIVLSPWAVAELRFDPGLDPSAHAYDIDICFQARANGKKVVVAPVGVSHHHDLVVLRDPSDWIEAHQRLARKWDGAADERSWEERSRLAEARAGAAGVARNQLSLLRNEAERRAVDAEARARAAELVLADARREAREATRRLEVLTSTRVYKVAAAVRTFALRLWRRSG